MMSEENLLPNSSFSDTPIRSTPPPGLTSRELADILAPVEEDGGEEAGPPYPFSTFSLYQQIKTSQADARDLLGL